VIATAIKPDRRVAAIRRALVAWYARHQRDLPWRRTRDPYAVWVSEIMLQQTQVATVIPYYERWLRLFPDVRALAAARLDAVLKAWEGLGYYSRARNMRRAAREIITEFRGRFPETVDGLLKLPGVGRYTAGAIASIAFGRDEPALDGNVVRALCRVFRVSENPKQPATQRRLRTLAGELLPPGRAGFFNQALMDLGATVCVPRAPRCNLCPLNRLCQAHAHGEEAEIPLRTKRKPVPHFDIAAGVVRRGDRILIARRKAEGLLGGLWEFPGGKRRPGESLKSCAAREIREELGIEVDVLRPIITVKHAYTHFRITLHVFDCRWVSGRPRAIGCDAYRWVRHKELERYAFPKANVKVIAALR
jgi:A/G-specific adenine glycosylase